MNREQLILQINKKYGDGSIFKMGKKISEIKVLPTGLLSLDIATGVGGFPRGRIVEIFGPEATGKSMLLLSIIAQTQLNGGHCAFIDVEHALTPSFAELIGVDINNLYYSQPNNGAQALSIMETLIQSGMFDVVGLDSVAALITEEELAGEYTDHHIAPTAKLMSKALKRMTAIISKTQTVAVFINQIREKPMQLWGKKEYTTGGRALRFYSSLRIEVRKMKGDNPKEGHSLKCTLQKNRLAPPFSECELRLNYRTGIDRLHSLLQIAMQLDVVRQDSSWFYYKDMKWLGIEKMEKELVENGKLLDEIHKEIEKKTNG